MLKTLEHDPLRRYPTAGALAADLTRFLEGQPVEARPRTVASPAARVALRGGCGRLYRRCRHGVAPSLSPRNHGFSRYCRSPTLSSNPADRYLSDGLTDGVADSLARENALKVIGEFLDLPVRGKKPDVREVGRLLDVASVLEGSIERTADRVKVIARLDRASDGSLLWSRSYERKAGDLFAVQSELVAGIARSLNVSFRSSKIQTCPQRRSVRLGIEGELRRAANDTESSARAGTEYRHAIDLDPEYGAVYLGLGTVQYDQALARGGRPRTEAECKSAAQFSVKHWNLTQTSRTPMPCWGLFPAIRFRDWLGAEHELLSAVAGHDDSERGGTVRIIPGFSRPLRGSLNTHPSGPGDEPILQLE